MHRLINYGRNTGSHLHPIPSQDFCAVLEAGPSKPPATISPQPQCGQHWEETEV